MLYSFCAGLTFAPGMPYLRKVSHVKKKDDGPCPICMSKLSEASGFDEGTVDNSGVYKLTKCGHMLHTPCVKAYIENSSFSQVNTSTPLYHNLSICFCTNKTKFYQNLMEEVYRK